MRVLIVDDAAVFRQVARDLLTLRGYEVVGQAADAATALAEAERLAPEGVLLDVRMDGGRGFELLAQLRRRLPPPAVLMVSADDDHRIAERARVSGACGFVPKSRLAAIDIQAFWQAVVP